jgi:anti-sigma B factor antagonist
MGTFLQVAERDIGDVTILQIKGQMVLDEGDIPLRKDIDALVEQGHVKLIFDLKDVSRLDSGGIGSLVSSYLRVHRHGGSVKLLRVPPRARKLLAITRLDSVFELYDSEAAAVASFQPH